MRAIVVCDLLSVLVIWQKRTTCLSMDKRVLEKMTELANAGVRRVPEMQRHIKHYIEQVLFTGSSVPPLEDSRFWPSGKAVINCIYRANRRARFVTFFSIHYVHFYCATACNTMYGLDTRILFVCEMHA